MSRQQQIEARLAEIRGLLTGEAEVDVNALEAEVRALQTEKTELEEKAKRAAIAAGIQTGAIQAQSIQVPGAVVSSGEGEYRKAFMDYVLRNKRSEVLETRATTLTSDVGSVIPDTIIGQIVEKLKAHGTIWNKITKTNVKGGVTIPTSSLKPTASWTSEGSVAAKQNKTTGSVTFSYHKLQMRVAVSLEASTTSLDMFEQALVENIYEAMIVAVEEAVVSGSGTGRPLGIIQDTSIPAAQKIAVLAADVNSYAKWVAIVSNIPLAYEGKVSLTMTKKDWDTNIVGMVDSQGQPVARVTFGLSGRPERRFLGYEVVLVDDYLTTFASGVDGTTFAYFADYSDYVFNSNMQLLYKKYFDEDTDEFIDKATLIGDGKLKGPHSVLLLNKSVPI
jgi:HK97 family phage major capsid protein